MQIICLPSKNREIVKSSIYRPSSDVLYVQPPRGAIKIIRESYKPRVIRFETDTTYTSSYFGPENFRKPRRNDVHNTPKVYGKFDMNTSNKVTYKWPKIERPKTCYPQPRIGCGTSPMECVTVHSSSYINPGVVRTKSAKINHKVPVTAPMESTTIVRESYQHPGPTIKHLTINNLTNNRGKWKLSVKPDYETINSLSYQSSNVNKRKKIRPEPKKTFVSAKIDCETTYNTSYMIPGYFVRNKRD